MQNLAYHSFHESHSELFIDRSFENCRARKNQSQISTYHLFFYQKRENIILSLFSPLQFIPASLLAQLVKKFPAVQETWVRSLGQEDPLEKEMATHSIFLPGEFHGQRILVGYSPWGPKELETPE